jgi:hypothetical protein
MSLYTSDIDIIYDGIHSGNIDRNIVRIITSKYPQSLDLLRDFPNIEEILCPIVFSLKSTELIHSLIMSCHKLKKAVFIIYITKPELSDSPRPIKRRRVTQLSPYHRILKISIPNIIRKLGSRMKYIMLDIMVINADNDNYTAISLDNGYFHINSDRNIHVGASDIFDALVSVKSLTGLSTDGNTEYNLDKILYIPEITITACNNTEDNPINREYLAQLVSMAETIVITYNPSTISERYIYSNILLENKSDIIKRIKGVVPCIDVDDLIYNNKYLDEIHVLVCDNDDIENMKYIMSKYDDRYISYFIHYLYQASNDNDKYWLCLKNYGDVVFNDIVRTLMES